ncbi:DNA polymerase II, partial [archaeon]
VLEADIRFYMRYMLDNNVYTCSWNTIEVEEVPNKEKWQVDAVYLAKSTPSRANRDGIPELRVLAFDIECYNPRGTPKPDRDPIIMIGIATNRGDRIVLKADDLNDSRIIKEFVEFVRKFDPDVIVGYNSNGFDWTYLLERSKRLRIRLNLSRANSEPAQSVYGHFSILGRANVDLYDFAEELTEVKVKTLENVADYLGVKKKSERVLIEGAYIYKYWDDPSKRSQLEKYLLDDIESTLGLSEKFLPFAIQLSSIVGLPLDQVGSASVGFRVEWHLMRHAYEFGELIPNRIERPYSTYKGAIVLKPKPGIHENIAVLDFSSMYPNLMIKYNISPDTYVSPMDYKEGEDVYIAPEVGHMFRKHPDGFYRKVLRRLLEARNAIRNKLKDLKPDSPEYRVLYERQRALKVIANATYGYCGWLGARWYKREVAETTTAWGRYTIKDTIELAKKIGLKVIYGDTDSIFVIYDKAKVNKLTKLIRDKLGLEIKPDKIYVRVFFTEAKKRYCGLLTDGRIDVVGLEAVRGDWSELAKEVQEKVIEIILRENRVDRAVDYVRKVIKKLERGEIPLSKLIIWKTIGKELEEYESATAHVSAAKKLIEAGFEVDKGDKVGYIIVKGSGRLSDKAMPYLFVDSFDQVDIEYYIKKQVVVSALRILEYFGIREDHLVSEKRQASLLDFFT